MKKPVMLEALAALDNKLKEPLTLLIGGGAAMLLAHGLPLATNDIDGLPIDSKMTAAQLDPIVKSVAHELKIRS